MQGKFTIEGQIAERFECERLRTGHSISAIISCALDLYLRELEEFRALGVAPPKAPEPEPEPEPKPKPKPKPKRKRAPKKAPGRLEGIPETREEVFAYFEERGSTREQAKAFLDYWEPVEWKREGRPLKSWGRAANTWMRKAKKWQKDKPALEVSRPAGEFDL